jgi:hypothetical protein
MNFVFTVVEEQESLLYNFAVKCTFIKEKEMWKELNLTGHISFWSELEIQKF